MVLLKIMATLLSLYPNPLVHKTYDCDFLKELTPSQVKVIEYSYSRGQELDLGYTLAAISLVESRAGAERVNWSDPSFGAYHIYIHTAVKRLDITDKIQQVHLANQLTVDDELGATLALNELSYWNERWKGDWQKMVKSYNAGNTPSNGVAYMNKVKKYVKKLEGCKL